MVKKICNIMSTIIMIVLIFVALVIIGPKVVGGETLAVISGSMEPNIPVGSVVLTMKTNPNELKKDDVITYRLNDSTLVTHRVVSVDKEKKEIVTKGDANENYDSMPVSFNQVVGKVNFHFPYLGYIVMNIKTPLGIAGLCGIVFVIILLNFIPQLVDEKNKKKDEE